MNYLVSIHKWLFCPISASGSNFNPRNKPYIPAVKIFAFLELEQNISFLDGHCYETGHVKPYLNILLTSYYAL